MGEIHELFVLALSLVWFAGATPDGRDKNPVFFGRFALFFGRSEKSLFGGGEAFLGKQRKRRTG